MKPPYISLGRVSFRSWVTILALSPLAVYFVFAAWVRPISPIYAHYDPEFAYMLNSLEVLKGRPYFYADHPGGPVEVLGTLIYVGTYPLLQLDLDQFIRYHLAHPGAFLTTAHGLLLLLSAITLIYLVRFRGSSDRTARLEIASVAGLLYFASHPLAFDSLLVWSHNSFGFAFGTLLLALLYRLLLDAPVRHRFPHKRLLILSLGAGLLASITIFFAAWICAFILIVAVWHALLGASWRRGVLSIVTVSIGGAAGLFLGIFPLLHRMGYFTDWIIALTSHKHPYLLVAPEQALLTQWWIGFRALFVQLPALFALMFLLTAVSIVSIVRQRKAWQRDPASVAMAIGLPIVCTLLTLAILDHPKTDYMLAVAAMLPVLALALEHLNRPFLSAHKIVDYGLASLVILAVTASLMAALIGHSAQVTRISQIESQTTRLQREYAEKQGRGLQSLVVVWTYGTYSPCFSLWFGNDYTDNAFRREIGRQCPRQIAYDYFGEMVIPRQGAQNLDERDWDMIIGCGDAFKKAELGRFSGGVTFPGLRLSCGDLTVAYREP